MRGPVVIRPRLRPGPLRQACEPLLEELGGDGKPPGPAVLSPPGLALLLRESSPGEDVLRGSEPGPSLRLRVVEDLLQGVQGLAGQAAQADPDLLPGLLGDRLDLRPETVVLPPPGDCVRDDPDDRRGLGRGVSAGDELDGSRAPVSSGSIGLIVVAHGSSWSGVARMISRRVARWVRRAAIRTDGSFSGLGGGGGSGASVIRGGQTGFPWWRWCRHRRTVLVIRVGSWPGLVTVQVSRVISRRSRGSVPAGRSALWRSAGAGRPRAPHPGAGGKLDADQGYGMERSRDGITGFPPAGSPEADPGWDVGREEELFPLTFYLVFPHVILPGTISRNIPSSHPESRPEYI